MICTLDYSFISIEAVAVCTDVDRDMHITKAQHHKSETLQKRNIKRRTIESRNFMPGL